MVSSTYKYTKTAAWAAQFDVPVSANGTSVLKYRIRAKWWGQHLPLSVCARNLGRCGVESRRLRWF